MTISQLIVKLQEIAYSLPVGDDEKVEVFVRCGVANVDGHTFTGPVLTHGQNEQKIVRIEGDFGA